MFFQSSIRLKTLHRFILYRSWSGLGLWEEELSTTTKHQIESHWKSKLEIRKFDENENHKEKFYVLSMFPYPSGYLHMGHVRVYTISDAVARFHYMNGKNIIHPIGWDAFGLPAENAALERGIAPDVWTRQNIAHMKTQLERLNCSFEWHREIATCDPEYYRWTQDLFLKLYEKGFIYQKEAMVNWDPVDQTVLAEEQVDENGCSWRSGAKVQRKPLRQWFVKTTRYAESLFKGLDDPILEEWRDITKIQQHWIGECNGVAFEFKLCNNLDHNSDSNISLWTDHPAFLDKAAFVAISSSHILAAEQSAEVENGTTKLNFTVKNPLNKKEIPIYMTNQIEYLPSTDTYLGIPCVSEEAKAFADRFKIPYEKVSEDFSPSDIIDIQSKVCREAQDLNVGGYWTSGKLRDWLISRQRYWGTPIPIIHCNKCGAQPVPSNDLPVKLPVTSLQEKGRSSLKGFKEWFTVKCPKCGGPATRETDTMDTFFDSSWYYLRYLDPKNTKEMFSIDKAKKMTPVDLYVGGKEHAVLHLYYARFISHFLHSLDLVPEKEPFKRLLVQGMVMGRSFRIKGTGKYVPEDSVKITDLKKNKAVVKDTGEPVVVTWEKMSKSKYNGVSPDDMFEEYGVDTTRLLILADVAPTSHRNWNSNTFPGIINWQRRLWLTIQQFLKHRSNLPPITSADTFKSHEDYLFDSRNYYVKGATFNYNISQQLSVALSKQQGLTNSLRKSPPEIYAHGVQFERALACQLILLAPMAPHFASELWSGFTLAPNRLNNTGEIHWDKTVLEQKWPTIDIDYQLDLICEVNGSEKCIIKMPRSDLDCLCENEAIRIALNQKEVQEILLHYPMESSHFTLVKGYESVINIRTRKKEAAES